MKTTQDRPAFLPQNLKNEIEVLLEEAYRQGWLDRRRFEKTPHEVWDSHELARLEREGLL